MLRNARNTLTLATLFAMLVVFAPAAGAKPVQPKLKSVKAVGTNVVASGSVKLPAKSKLHGKKLKVRVTLKPASGKSVSKSKSIKAKRKAATVKFKVTVAAPANGAYKVSAQIYAGKKKFGKASKSKTVTVTGFPAGGGSSASGYPVSVGGAASCALVGDQLKCWGAGIAAGNGDSNGSETAVPVLTGLGGTGFRFSVGSGGTCFLLSGGIKCWGSSYYGQLGNGTSGAGEESATPVQVDGLTTGGSGVSLGDTHACAISGGKIYCWGRNDYGQLGNNSSGGGSSTPQEVVMTGMGTPYLVVANSMTTCANTSNGIWCWGLNSIGQLGTGGATPDLTPHKVPEHVQGTLAGPINDPNASLDVGNDHVCAQVSGTAYCWGSNQYGQLGKPLSTASSSLPVNPDGLPVGGVALIDTGYYVSCALVSGTAKCWGINSQGETGTGSIGAPVPTPTTVVGLESGTASISAGWGHSCGSRGTTVLCWGSAGGGKSLGNGQTSDTGTPVAVQGL